MARLRRAGPSGPGRAPSMGAGSTQGERWTGEGFPPQATGAGGGVSPLGAAAQTRSLAWGRTARAAAAAPFPRTRRQVVPAVTHPGLTALAEPSGRPPAPGMLSPRKLPVKGAAACGLRVPPLRSGQTPDSELPRQDQALAGRTGGKMRNTLPPARGLEQRCATVAGQEAPIAPHHGRGCPAIVGRQVLD
jgi:hypothetical protein